MTRYKLQMAGTRVSQRRWSRLAIPACSALLLCGCQTFSLSPPFGRRDLDAAAASPLNETASEPADKTLVESTKKSATRVMNFVSGKEQEDRARAQALYQEGDRLFRRASALAKDDAIDDYRDAAKKFRKAAEASPGTALQQDAMFMQGECLFFADRLTDATEVYQKLQKDFPRNRHNDLVAARLFSISRYWIETVKASPDEWITFNLTDPKKPRLDVDGHAIRVLDQIRYDDPTGRLADDATMAAAAEFIRQEKFDRADEFLTDLREAFTDSDHLFLAHMLGIQCKLEIYAGPRYSGLVLDEAEKLVNQTRQRFPDRMADQKYAEMVARASARVSFLRAERLAYRAEYREKRKEYGAARYYYKELLKLHGDTPQAETARQRLAETEQYPSVPKQQLAWLTTLFPDSRSSEPLQTTLPTDGAPADNDTILR